jgi:DNA ligase-1
MNSKTNLYALDAKKKMRVWSIWYEDDEIYMESGLVDGEKTLNSEPVKVGLAGRSQHEQMMLRINSRINKKKSSGYTGSIEQALQGRTNELGYQRPMKAKRLNKAEDVPDTHCYIDHKLDGHHCSIINDNGKNVAYSNGGKLIETFPELLESIRIPLGVTLEGELYHHGTPLETISSWVRKRQPETLNLKFFCYDAMLQNIEFSQRRTYLENMIEYGPYAELLATSYLIGEFNILPILRGALKDGYEGLMVRVPEGLFESGKRSKNLLKVKREIDGEFIIDDEFLVVDVKASVDGWAILICETHEGKTFSTSAPGDIEQKAYVLKRKDKFIGRHVRGEFAGYTKYKKPFHFVSKDWREISNE